MDVGVYVPQLGFDFDDVLHRALRCEALGYESLWLYDHLYGPGAPGLPSLEAWTLATALLARTSTLRVGHMVLCANFRHPALLAKMAITLDVISGGRLDLGLGSGSVEQEHHQAGLPWGSMAERSARLAETAEVVVRMCASERVTFHGEHVRLEDLPSLPRPVQRPHPPLVIGGAGERRTLPIVARYADVWNVPTYALDGLDRRIDALHRACDAVGRDPAEIRLSIEAVLALAPDEASLPEVRAVAERRFGGPGFGLHEAGLVGTAPSVLDRIGELRDLGFDHLVVFTHDRAADETLERFATDVVAHL